MAAIVSIHFPHDDRNASDHETNQRSDNEQEPLLPAHSHSNRNIQWRQYTGIILTLAASVQYAFGNVMAKDANPITLFFWKCVGLTPCVFLHLYHKNWRREQIYYSLWPFNTNKTPLKLLLILCITTTFADLFQIGSIQCIKQADFSTLLYITPVLVMITSHRVLDEQLGFTPILCGIITAFGAIIIIRPPIFTGEEKLDLTALLGLGPGLASIFCNVASVITLRCLALHKVHYVVILLFLWLWAVLVTFVIFELFTCLPLPKGLYEWLLHGMLFNGCFHTFLYLLPLACFILAFQFEDTGTVALFRTCDILFVIIWQCILQVGETDLISFLGAFIVLFGVFLSVFRKYVAPPKATGLVISTNASSIETEQERSSL